MKVRILRPGMSPAERFLFSKYSAAIAKGAGIDEETMRSVGVPDRCFDITVHVRLRRGATLAFPRAFCVRDHEKLLVMTRISGPYCFATRAIAEFDLRKAEYFAEVPESVLPKGLTDGRYARGRRKPGKLLTLTPVGKRDVT